MLTPKERSDITELLANRLALQDSPRRFFEDAIRDLTQQRRFLLSFQFDVRDALQSAECSMAMCLADCWTAAPSWLECVLTHLNRYEQQQALVAIIGRIQRHEDPNPDPFQRTWFGIDMPFYDRASLRLLLRVLLTTPARPVLRINGPSGAGLSYTDRVIGELAQLSGPIHVSSAHITSSTASSFDLRDLVTDLTLSLTDSDLPEQRKSSYPVELARWVVKMALAQPGMHVLVIDGAGLDQIEGNDIDQFVGELAIRVCRNEIRMRTRLVLINYAEPLPVQPFDMDEETLKDPSQLGAADLIDCISQMIVRRQSCGKPAWEDATPVALATQILARAPAVGKERLSYVNDQLRTLLNAV
jgi:hypothetical protein